MADIRRWLFGGAHTDLWRLVMRRGFKVQSDVHYFTWIFYNIFQNVVSQAKEINTMKIVVDKQYGM
jgi:hypothetical protein